MPGSSGVQCSNHSKQKPLARFLVTQKCDHTVTNLGVIKSFNQWLDRNRGCFLGTKCVENSEYDTLVLALCEVIRDNRKKRNLSQSELSRRSGLHRSYIGDLERGARNLSVKNMFRLAAALDISATELVKMAELRVDNNELTLDLARVKPVRTA